jgi:hypothetical protein
MEKRITLNHGQMAQLDHIPDFVFAAVIKGARRALREIMNEQQFFIGDIGTPNVRCAGVPSAGCGDSKLASARVTLLRKAHKELEKFISEHATTRQNHE